MTNTEESPMKPSSMFRVTLTATALLTSSAFACPGLLQICTPQACGPIWAAEHGLPANYVSRSLPGRDVDQPAGSFATLGTAERSAPTASGMKLMGRLTLGQMGGGQGSSLFGWVDPLTRREYAIMGRSNGTAFIDISDPAEPIYVANLPPVSGSSNTSWREPKVYQNTVYIGVDGTTHGMQVMDLTRLRNYAGSTLTLSADSVYTGVTRIHTLGVNQQSGFLYAAGTNVASGGLHVLNVSNPMSPTFAGNYSLDGYNHEAQIVTYNGPDPDYQGREIAFNSNGRTGTGTDRFNIVDVTNKAAMSRISSSVYAEAGYAHQTWLTEDQRYAFMNDELDETGGLTGGVIRTHLWDLLDLDNPVYRGFFEQEGGIDHNLYVKGKYVYQSNYTTGLRVFEIGDLSSEDPTEWLKLAAFYDTYAANDAATFNGAWNNYPYFPSGNIPISDIDGGLFVVRMDLKSQLPTNNNLDPFFNNGNGLPDPNALANVPEPTTLAGAMMLTMLAARRRR
jgi:choice-of-anchor B domain-containing protein